MGKWIKGEVLARRWRGELERFEIFDCLASGALKPYSSLTGKKYKWLDFDRQNHSMDFSKWESFKLSLFLAADIEKFEQQHGIKTANQTEPTTPAWNQIFKESPPNSLLLRNQIENDETSITDPKDGTKKYLAAIGSRGGSQSKKKEPFLEALSIFMRENAKTANRSNNAVAELFCKRYPNEGKNLSVTVDSVKWEVFSHGKLIFARVQEDYQKKAKKPEYSIKYDTFRNTYIPLVKKSIHTDQSNNPQK